MIGRLFPKQFDNQYRGHKLAIWLLVPVVGLKVLMGFNVSGFNPWVDNRFVLKSADGIAIDAFGAEAASTVVFMFASWGLGILLLSLMSVVVLIRYRAMIPLMYLVLAAEQVGRKAIQTMNPIVKTAVETEAISSGVLINWALTTVLLVGLILSLARPRVEGVDREG